MKHLPLYCMLAMPLYLFGQKDYSVIYKKTATQELHIEILEPKGKMPKEGFPAVVFFFGGGWKGGETKQFIEQAKHLQNHGILSFLVDYRTQKSAGTSPRESLMDAKSAMRYIKTHAKNLNINPQKIAASGGSAGGHLAAATCYIQSFNDPADNLDVSPKPAALILFNPVIDNSKDGYGYERVKDYYQEFSPIHNIKKPVPTIFFVGSQDTLISQHIAENYKRKCEELGGRCDLHIYQGRNHGFFNYGKKDYQSTMNLTMAFLKSVQFIK
ncbi:alpha/beta hydrolase [Bacteroides sp.]|uniref:alpha/beta hydrolase n=1 Tax=Bacteroides sp. TaxID=29523 RepID=UPI0025C6A8DD|nr:alpha/beta hydrolase [Bacteroides sp.]